ncbi:hypothetical protein BDQ17DRAFT_1381233 [Cyathus striatus]|nr:hypothetical protein BDQ17DRAFT_1381233 [Cyathus striatus]
MNCSRWFKVLCSHRMPVVQPLPSLLGYAEFSTLCSYIQPRPLSFRAFDRHY